MTTRVLQRRWRVAPEPVARLYESIGGSPVARLPYTDGDRQGQAVNSLKRRLFAYVQINESPC